MTDHPDTLCQEGGGRTRRTRRSQASGGNAGRSAPKHTARRKWTWNRKPDFSLGLVKHWVPSKGRLLCTSLSYSRAAWGFGAGGRAAGHRRAGAVGRKQQPELSPSIKATEGREQPAPALCKPGSPLGRPDPRRECLVCTAGGLPVAFRQVVTGQRRLDLHFRSFTHIHSLIHASINYLAVAGAGEQNSPSSQGPSQFVALWSDGWLEFWLLYSPAV